MIKDISRAYALRSDSSKVIYVDVVRYEEYLGLTMVYFEVADGSKGAMDRRTFFEFYTAIKQD